MSVNPIDNEDLYDAIVLAGVRSPGFVTLSGHERVVNWDIKEANGQSGASMTRKGDKVGSFTASFYLVKDPVLGIDEFADWDAFAALINSTVAGKTPKALDVYHPDLAANDFKSVVKASIGGMAHDGKGGATVVVKFTEYAPPKPKGGSPKGSSGLTAGKVDPNADAKAEVQKLLDQAKAA